MQVYSRSRSMGVSVMRSRKSAFRASRPVKRRSVRGFGVHPVIQASLVSAAGLALASGLQAMGVV